MERGPYYGATLFDDSVTAITMYASIGKHDNPPKVQFIVRSTEPLTVQSLETDLSVGEQVTSNSMYIGTTSMQGLIEKRVFYEPVAPAGMKVEPIRISEPACRSLMYNITYQPMEFKDIEYLSLQVRIRAFRNDRPILITDTLLLEKEIDTHWWFLRDC